LRLCASALSANVFVCKYDRSSSTQRGGWLSNKWSVFIFSTGTERKKFLMLIFPRRFCLDQETSTKTTRIGNLHYAYHRQKIADKKVGSADRQRITTKYRVRVVLTPVF
jgi:hypothetical protein